MKSITVSTLVHAPVEKVWEYWNEPEYITKWAFATNDWEAPHSDNDLRVGGRFMTRMQAKDGSQGFDFGGEYLEVVPHERIVYIMDDDRKVINEFKETEDGVEIVSTFDMENENPEEIQRAGWQVIMNNFKKVVEVK